MNADSYVYRVNYDCKGDFDLDWEMSLWIRQTMGFPDNLGVAGDFIGYQFNDRWAMNAREQVVAFRDKEDAVLFKMFFGHVIR